LVQIPDDASDESFDALMEASLKKKRRRVQPGEKVTATVVRVGEHRVLLDLEGGLDGSMEMSELAEPGTDPNVKVGDKLEGWVLRVADGLVELGKSAGKGQGGRRTLEEAYQTRLPVEGMVAEVNKGGLVVEVSGVRCFCPLGQMDIRRIEDPTVLVGQKLLFLVAELRSEKDVVLSRRRLLEREQEAKAEETRKSLIVGARFRGTVTNVRDFGAFVDLGGVEGLVPASELAYGRQRPQDVLSPGQEVEVEVMRMEPGRDGKGERISLSMKVLADDPFEATVEALPEGTIVEGLVTRIQPFGAFVEIVPGVEGLIHVSAFGKRVGHPSEVVREGRKVVVRVDGVDREKRRVSLEYVDPDQVSTMLGGAPPPDGPASGPRILGHTARTEPAPGTADGGRRAPRGPGASVGQVMDVTVDKVESFGVFVRWDGGRGLVPGSELGVPRNSDLRKGFPVGSTFRATVVEVRPDGKVNLSKTAVEKAEERADTEAYMAGRGAPAGRGFGTLGDLLKVKLPKK
jgi:small subunit ribosomal protein S1